VVRNHLLRSSTITRPVDSAYRRDSLRQLKRRESITNTAAKFTLAYIGLKSSQFVL
jgi:hypothetical protein